MQVARQCSSTGNTIAINAISPHHQAPHELDVAPSSQAQRQNQNKSAGLANVSQSQNHTRKDIGNEFDSPGPEQNRSVTATGDLHFRNESFLRSWLSVTNWRLAGMMGLWPRHLSVNLDSSTVTGCADWNDCTRRGRCPKGIDHGYAIVGPKACSISVWGIWTRTATSSPRWEEK